MTTAGGRHLIGLKCLLPLATADAIADKALALGRAEGMQALTVAVLDQGGHLVVLKREDGSGILRTEIAIGKAWGALGMGISSRALRDRMGDRPVFPLSLAAASDGRFIAAPGGVLILDGDGAAIGAVGISGDTSDKDEYCAIQAVQAAGLATDPAQPAEGWRG